MKYNKKQSLKLVTAELLLNNPVGIDVNEVQLAKQSLKLVTAELLLNNPVGIDVNDVQL